MVFSLIMLALISCSTVCICEEVRTLRHEHATKSTPRLMTRSEAIRKEKRKSNCREATSNKAATESITPCRGKKA